MTDTMPTVYLPHGGGPWPFVDLGLSASETEPLRAYLRGVPASLPRAPSALLVVSAHWECPEPTLMSHPSPPLLFDYYGFPEASYRLTWSAPGAPELVARVLGQLSKAGFAPATDAERGFDHGTFVPLKVMFPKPTLPTLQLSLLSSLDPAEHFALGRALRPLREEGVLIVGSGMSYHHLPNLMRRAGAADAETFDAWLSETMAAAPEARRQALLDWPSAPAARAAHPREEHLLPLMVVAGAAEEAPAHRAYNGTFAAARVSAFHLG